MPPEIKRRLWGTVLALKELYPDREKWNYEVCPALENLFREYQGSINLWHIAFPEDWSIQIKK